MAKEKIEDISTQKLLRRKKLTSTLLVLLIAATVLNGAGVIYELIIGNGFNINLFIPAIVCFGFALYMYKGLKNINKELARRKDK